MAIERKLVLPASSDEISRLLLLPLQHRTRLDNELVFGNVRYKKAINYVRDPDTSTGDDETPKTVFEAGMPGAMSADDVERDIDLGRWTLKLGGKTVRLEVSTAV